MFYLKRFWIAWTNISLVLRICIGLVLGAILGVVVPEWSGISVFGNIFVNALKAIAPILVAVLVTSSIAKATGSVGNRFSVVIGQYLLSTFIAALCAVVVSMLFPVTLFLEKTVDSTMPSTLSNVFINLLINLVSNPVASVSNANYVGILFWSVLIGLAMKKIAKPAVIDLVSGLADVISVVIKWIIQFAPFGIFGLVFSAVSESGMEIFTTYGHLVLVLVGCMLINALIFNPIISFFLIRKNPYPLLFTCLKESGVNAFFTRSSAANIPINMALCKRLGLDEEFYSVSIPLGATINMDGAAVTITVMSLAVAHTVGVDVNFYHALFLSIIATIGACGASGVAGGSLLLVPLACSFLGIGNDVAMQAVAVGFIIGVIQDSVETALNSSGDVFFTASAELYERRKKLKRKGS